MTLAQSWPSRILKSTKVNRLSSYCFVFYNFAILQNNYLLPVGIIP